MYNIDDRFLTSMLVAQPICLYKDCEEIKEK